MSAAAPRRTPSDPPPPQRASAEGGEESNPPSQQWPEGEDLQYRTCDKCPGEVRAAVVDKLMFNGVRYTLDLCEHHSLELFGAVMAWADLGTPTGETSRVDQQTVVRDVTFDVELPAPRTTSVEAADLVEDEPASVTPIRAVLAVGSGIAAGWPLAAAATQPDLRRAGGSTLAVPSPHRMRSERALRAHDRALLRSARQMVDTKAVTQPAPAEPVPARSRATTCRHLVWRPLTGSNERAIASLAPDRARPEGLLDGELR